MMLNNIRPVVSVFSIADAHITPSCADGLADRFANFVTSPAVGRTTELRNGSAADTGTDHGISLLDKFR